MAFRYYVLLANMRTGSNLFEQNISQYEGFPCHGELFNPHFVGCLGETERFGVSLEERERKPQKLLNRMLAEETGKVPGFRLFSDHDPRMLDHVLKDESCAKIVLTRNPLDSFVSYRIAQATDQWKLRDVSARRTARVTFDILAFRRYLRDLEEYLWKIRRALQVTGQTAFHMRYEDLSSVEVFNGLVRFLGGSEERKDLGQRIVRQNPESLREKVENYDEMVEQLRGLDLLGIEALPPAEPARNPGTRNFVAGREVPLLFLAMEPGAFPQVSAWVAGHQRSGTETDLSQKQLLDWLARNPGRRSFAVLSHPLRRAYRAFDRHIFTAGPGLFPWIRSVLESQYGVVLPPLEMCEAPNRAVLENSGYGPRQHGAAFTGFLRFLKGNLRGQTRARIDPSWALQSAFLQAVSRLVPADALLREETLAEDLARLEDAMGLDRQPLGPGPSAPCFPLEEILQPVHEKLAREAYARDYQVFGFGDLA